ncbi:ABC transporter ATP-binding protein [Paraflavitalea sp. CAU 1676]|uniref:ABC transporter ATP-binding protein n=1 Tax=Paraflavitalea sp. CAU 1676 TaxID=3032598 RepID=UPI0023DB8473|nr:ABC transporter ATP-binding protein [Paraflavitalea sp. CAU 1676]MDF2189455.1 ABC transporter ATP-binding protein [Paraflavitalea sp. CAU 1676]
MSNVVIEAQHISKRYRLGPTGTGSIRQDVQRWWRGNADPFFRERTDPGTLWALKDIDFTMQRGDIWGIVGDNGAGKSTLLKIISRIIQPTTGRVRGRGTVGSLLEVGTGFHPELSGRENIFISGYLLGMNKARVKEKFDEIVAFSGIEQFIDTPVKRYSSGMYVRLAFSVAAHLEPDILIMDEVLAVGDTSFQKKCLDKMKELSGDGQRTILFVSHNMQAVHHLCKQAMWLQRGQMVTIGSATEVVNRYVGSLQQHKLRQQWDDPALAPGNEFVRIMSFELIPELVEGAVSIDVRTSLTVKFSIRNEVAGALLNAGLHLYNYAGECIFDVASPATACAGGLVQGECKIPAHFLNDGAYYFSLIIVRDTSIPVYYHEGGIHFEVADYRENTNWYGKWKGAVRPQFPFSFGSV